MVGVGVAGGTCLGKRWVGCEFFGWSGLGGLGWRILKAFKEGIYYVYIYICLENLVYHVFRQLWLVLGVKLMEINSNWFSRCI